MKTNKTGAKILAMIAIITMVICAFSIAIPSEAIESEGGSEEVEALGPETATASLEINGETTYYGSLVEAWDVAVNQTKPAVITLLKDEIGNGLQSISSKGANVTLDLGGNTYTATADPAGSEGTKNQGMQLLKGNTFTIQNGIFKTKTGDDGKMKNGINVYCDTIFKDVTLDFSESNGSDEGYNGLQLANGVVSITGNTSILERPEDYAIAFFANWSGYTNGSQVTIDTTGTIDGQIVIGEFNPNDQCGKSSLNIINMKKTDNTYINYSTNYGFDLKIAEDLGIEITIDAGETVTGKIAYGSNSISFKELKVGSNGLTVSEGSVIIEGDLVTTVGSTITVTGGTAKLVADIPEGMNVVINGDATLEIPEGASITNDGTITNNGNTSIKGTLTNKGTVNGDKALIITGENAKIEGTAPETTPEVIIDQTGKTPISSTILAFEGDVIIDGDAYLIGDLEIPAEKKLIIRSTGTLDLGGYGLTINGEFIVESGAKVFGSDATTSSTKVNTIILMKGASIQNDGILGAVKEVTVKAGSVEDKYDGVGEVTLLNGSGVEFGLVNTTASDATTAQYTLTVTGDVYSDITSKITMKGVRIINDMTIGENVTLSVPNGDVKVYLMSGATLDVNGVMIVDNASKFIMKNKSTVIMNGVLVGKITAETGEYKTL